MRTRRASAFSAMSAPRERRFQSGRKPPVDEAECNCIGHVGLPHLPLLAISLRRRRRKHITNPRDAPSLRRAFQDERSPHSPRLAAGQSGEIIAAVCNRNIGRDHANRLDVNAASSTCTLGARHCAAHHLVTSPPPLAGGDELIGVGGEQSFHRLRVPPLARVHIPLHDGANGGLLGAGLRLSLQRKHAGKAGAEPSEAHTPASLARNRTAARSCDRLGKNRSFGATAARIALMVSGCRSGGLRRPHALTLIPRAISRPQQRRR